MCNRFKVDISPQEIADHFAGAFTQTFAWKSEIVPRAMTPGILRNGDGDSDIVPMQFAFCSPDKDPTTEKRMPTNARVEKFTKWPWFKVSDTNRCLIPMTSFREPCYWGETAGKEVWFIPTERRVLAAAGLFSTFTLPDGSPLVTMALLMRPASPYVMDKGHHRQPVFLRDSGYDDWMGNGKRDPKESLAILRQFAIEPEMRYEVDREMAASWSKRAPGKVATRDEQLEDMSW